MRLAPGSGCLQSFGALPTTPATWPLAGCDRRHLRSEIAPGNLKLMIKQQFAACSNLVSRSASGAGVIAPMVLMNRAPGSDAVCISRVAGGNPNSSMGD